jgi:hypothetical protein
MAISASIEPETVAQPRFAEVMDRISGRIMVLPAILILLASRYSR